MKKIHLTFAIILGSAFGLFAQEKIYMSFFETINMNKDYQYATSKLLKTYVDLGNKYEIILSQHDTNLVVETKDQALAKAKAMNINHVLMGELNRTGETVIVSLTMYKTIDGTKEWGSMQKASKPDDLDPIMQKIASGLNTKVDGAVDGDIYNVTEYESKELNKMKATTYYGVEVGGGVSSLHAKNNFPAGFCAIYSGDLRTVIIDVKGSMYFGDVQMYDLSLHANFPLTTKRNTPFLSSGLGYGSTILKKYKYVSIYDYNKNWNASGLTFFAGGGYILNRNSDINLRFNANGFFSMYKIDNSFPCGVLIGMSLFF
jgi:hypothetical protein